MFGKDYLRLFENSRVLQRLPDNLWKMLAISSRGFLWCAKFVTVADSQMTPKPIFHCICKNTKRPSAPPLLKTRFCLKVPGCTGSSKKRVLWHAITQKTFKNAGKLQFAKNKRNWISRETAKTQKTQIFGAQETKGNRKNCILRTYLQGCWLIDKRDLGERGSWGAGFLELEQSERGENYSREIFSWRELHWTRIRPIFVM